MTILNMYTLKFADFSLNLLAWNSQSAMRQVANYSKKVEHVMTQTDVIRKVQVSTNNRTRFIVVSDYELKHGIFEVEFKSPQKTYVHAATGETLTCREFDARAGILAKRLSSFGVEADCITDADIVKFVQNPEAHKAYVEYKDFRNFRNWKVVESDGECVVGQQYEIVQVQQFDMTAVSEYAVPVGCVLSRGYDDVKMMNAPSYFTDQVRVNADLLIEGLDKFFMYNRTKFIIDVINGWIDNNEEFAKRILFNKVNELAKLSNIRFLKCNDGDYIKWMVTSDDFFGGSGVYRCLPTSITVIEKHMERDRHVIENSLNALFITHGNDSLDADVVNELKSLYAMVTEINGLNVKSEKDKRIKSELVSKLIDLSKMKLNKGSHD